MVLTMIISDIASSVGSLGMLGDAVSIVAVPQSGLLDVVCDTVLVLL